MTTKGQGNSVIQKQGGFSVYTHFRNYIQRPFDVTYIFYTCMMLNSSISPDILKFHCLSQLGNTIFMRKVRYVKVGRQDSANQIKTYHPASRSSRNSAIAVCPFTRARSLANS